MAEAGDVERLIVLLEAKINDFEKNMQRASGTAARSYGQMRKESSSATRQMEADMSRSTSRINSMLASTSSSMGNFAKGAIAGGLAAATAEVTKFADAWTMAGNKIRAASSIGGLPARSLEELNDLARKTRSGFEDTVELYSRMLRVGENVTQSELDIAKATELVTKSFKAGGAAAQEQAAGILQLGQALGSGFLQGDELRSIRENAPVLAQAIADHFGVTIGKLKELGAEGKLTSEEIFKAILAGAKKIDAAFAQTTPTVAEGFVQMKNAALEFAGTLDRITGGSTALRNFFSDIINGLDQMDEGAKKFEKEGGLDAFLEMLGGRLEEGGILDQIRDKVNEVREEIKEAGTDFEAERARIVGEIGEVQEELQKMEESAADEKGTMIGDAFTEGAQRAREQLQELQQELINLERQAEASANNASNALANLAASAAAAMDAAIAASNAVPTVNGKPSNVPTRGYEVPGGGTVNVQRPTGGNYAYGMPPTTATARYPDGSEVDVYNFDDGRGWVTAGGTPVNGQVSEQRVSSSDRMAAGSEHDPVNVAGGAILTDIYIEQVRTADGVDRLADVQETWISDLTALIGDIRKALAQVQTVRSGGGGTGGTGGNGGVVPGSTTDLFGYGQFGDSVDGLSGFNYMDNPNSYVAAMEPYDRNFPRGFAKGGMMRPTGSGSMDSRLETILMRPDEAAAIMTPQQQKGIVSAFEQMAQRESGEQPIVVHMGGIHINGDANERTARIAGQAAADQFKSGIRNVTSRMHGR